MSKSVNLYAALEISRAASASGSLFLRGVGDVLGRHDGGLSAVRISTRHSAVAAASLIVKVETTRGSQGGARVCFRLASRPGRPAPDTDSAVSLLSDIVMRALPLADAVHVEWLGPGVRLTPEEFLAARSYTSPRRVRSDLPRLPDTEESIDTIDRNLAQMLKGDTSSSVAFRRARRSREAAEIIGPEQCSDRRAQAASWSFTTLVATIFPPIALVLSLLHIFRGADIRLSVHALTLTSVGNVLWQVGLLDPIDRITGL